MESVQQREIARKPHYYIYAANRTVKVAWKGDLDLLTRGLPDGYRLPAAVMRLLDPYAPFALAADRGLDVDLAPSQFEATLTCFLEGSAEPVRLVIGVNDSDFEALLDFHEFMADRWIPTSAIDASVPA